MVAIQGLGGIPEPKPEQPSKIRKDRETAATGEISGGSGAGESEDAIVISSEARAAAELSRIIQAATQQQGEIRADRVAAAKERIESGAYREPGVVAKTAEKLLKYLS